MGNENKKDFNVMMNNNKDMPKIQVIKDEKTIKKYGGTKTFFRNYISNYVKKQYFKLVKILFLLQFSKK